MLDNPLFVFIDPSHQTAISAQRMNSPTGVRRVKTDLRTETMVVHAQLFGRKVVATHPVSATSSSACSTQQKQSEPSNGDTTTSSSLAAQTGIGSAQSPHFRRRQVQSATMQPRGLNANRLLPIRDVVSCFRNKGLMLYYKCNVILGFADNRILVIFNAFKLLCNLYLCHYQKKYTS